MQRKKSSYQIEKQIFCLYSPVGGISNLLPTKVGLIDTRSPAGLFIIIIILIFISGCSQHLNSFVQGYKQNQMSLYEREMLRRTPTRSERMIDSMLLDSLRH
jgi:hypothetical protein